VREALDRVGRQAHRLADVAHRAARAIGNHRRREPGALARVLLVDVLDDLLAALVLEVDVDVGRLLALGRDEALEQHVDLGGIDRGDAEHEAHHRVRRRAAALAEDVLAACEAHDVVDGEEIGRVVELADQRQLVRQPLDDVGRRLAPALARLFPGQRLERLLRGHAVWHRLGRVLVAQLVEREAAAFDDLERIGDRVGALVEQPRHLGRRLQVALGIGEQARAGAGDRAFLADAGHDVLQRPPRRHVVERIVGRDQLHAEQVGEIAEPRDAPRVVAAEQMLGREIEPRAESILERREMGRELFVGQHGLIGECCYHQAVAVVDQVLAEQPALAFLDPALAGREHGGEAAIGGAVGGIDEHRGRVDEVEAAADHEPHAHLACRVVRAHDAGERVAVGDRDRREAERLRRRDHLRRRRRAAQEAEIGGRLQLGVGHPNTPWTYQRGRSD
jgi:hypothetical protein